MDRLFVGTKTEYAVAAVTTGKIFPAVFTSEEKAKQFKEERGNPSNWKIVSRKVIYNEWEEI